MGNYLLMLPMKYINQGYILYSTLLNKMCFFPMHKISGDTHYLWSSLWEIRHLFCITCVIAPSSVMTIKVANKKVWVILRLKIRISPIIGRRLVYVNNLNSCHFYNKCRHSLRVLEYIILVSFYIFPCILCYPIYLAIYCSKKVKSINSSPLL